MLADNSYANQNDTHFFNRGDQRYNKNNLVDEQQVEEGFLSEGEERDLSSITPPAVIIKSPPIRALETIRARQQNKMTGNTLIVNKSSPQAFVRCGSRRRRSSGRRRSGRAPRQVRFQPIPQSIDISNHEESLNNEVPPNDHYNDNQDDNQREVNDFKNNEMPKFIVTSVKKYRRVHLSAKPLTKKLHQLSHVKFNKIKLKSFNNLAHQLQQTLSASSYATNLNSSTKKVPNQSSSGDYYQQQQQQHNQYYQQQAVDSNANADDDFGWGSDFDEQSLDSSLASHCDKSQADGSTSYLLEMGKPSCDFRAINDVIQDQGISGQFKRIDDPNQSIVSAGPSSSASTSVAPIPPRRADSTTTTSAMKQNDKGGLPISNVGGGERDEFKQRQKQCEQVIRNSLKIAEKSDSGRIHLNADNDNDDSDGRASREAESEKQPPVVGCGEPQVLLDINEQVADKEDDDEDDEESLKSLEARQGFRQIRDKLKIILDQRLASYERSLGGETGVASSQSTQQRIATQRSEMLPPNESCAAEQAQEHSKKDTGAPEVAPASIDIRQHVKTSIRSCEFDCQSHCSDESGSSSGLDSNHSGSQDSGHSTQHSGYSSHSCGHHHHLNHHHHHHHHGHLSPSIIETSSSPTISSPSGQSAASPSSPTCHKIVEPAAAATSTPATSVRANKQHNDHETNERRMRFAQNRLIINSKLESIFKNQHQIEKSPQKEKQAGNSPLSASKSVVSSTGVCNRNVKDNLPVGLDLETRKRLLEQQRQMSLKLKQKPRRKSAKRALMNPSNAQQQVVDSDQATEDNGSYVSNSSSSELNRCNSIRRHQNGRRDSLTKQLSMICLRQAGQSSAQQHHLAVSPMSHLAGDCRPSQPQMIAGALAAEQTLPRAAQSLRQLVKDVIDDCERPNKLSALTMSILNRSDSLSSDLATSADEATNVASANNDYTMHLNGNGRCSSSLSSLKTLEHPPPPTGAAGEEPRLAASGASHQQCHLVSPQPIGYIYPVQHSTPQQHQHQVAADRSMSSVGSIDGLEYSRGSGGQPDVDEEAICGEPLDVENRATKSTTIGSYLKSLRDFSRLKLTKVRLMSAGSGESVQRKQPDVAAADQHLVGRKLAPSEPSLFGRDLGTGYNYEYQLDHHDRRQHQQKQQQPEGLSTLTGNWRRRPRRTSIIQSPMMARDDSPSLAKGDDFANHFVTISNRKWKSCYLRTNLMQIAFNGFNAAEQHKPAAGSPIGASKQHLAYLDNSKNFTDEDNY